VRVLVCHNYYVRRSGEETVVEQEMALLRENGHQVDLFSYDNADVEEGEFAERFDAGLRAIYSRPTQHDLKRFLRGKTFDIAHVHNTWGLMSPSVYRALWLDGLPVVKTVHNFRWLCPIGTFYRDGHVCRDCAERLGGLLHSVLHRCYQHSLSGSTVAASRLLLNRDLLGILRRYIDVIIVQNAFVRDLLVKYGFPADKMTVKGNFLRRTEASPGKRGDYAVFFGRLEASKGLSTLLDAVERAGISLRLFGQGPLSDWVKSQVGERFGGNERIRFEGYAPRGDLIRGVAGARAVVFPSEWYESYPITIVEAMAHGKPVIASDLGSIPSIVRDEVNGLLFRPGDAGDLADKIGRLWRDDRLQTRLETGARATYEAEMTPEKNYGQLLRIYESAIASRSGRQGSEE
jgi:glycosyltransferase involved in cell wall biosynthesis